MTKSSEYIALDDINIQIIRSKRRRTSQIEVKNKQVFVRAPHYLPQFLIRKFVNKKRNWIVQNLTKQLQQPQVVEKQFCDGETFQLFDQPFYLRINKNKTNPTKLINQELFVSVPGRVKNQSKYVRNKMSDWYKETALSHIRQRVEFFASLMEVKAKSVKVREYKRRWGSCSSNGELSFNWRIIMAPPVAIDYVVIHELAHISEFNHSKKFWQVVSKTMPDYNQQILWFKNNSYKLNF